MRRALIASRSSAASSHELSSAPSIVVVDESQLLTSDCIELLRYLHDHRSTRFALVLVGGNGTWRVLSREPMLASRVYRRVRFAPLTRGDVLAAIPAYHPIYADIEWASRAATLFCDHVPERRVAMPCTYFRRVDVGGPRDVTLRAARCRDRVAGGGAGEQHRDEHREPRTASRPARCVAAVDGRQPRRRSLRISVRVPRALTLMRVT